MTAPACMRCAICRRPLLRSAVPGLHIGPKCARSRDLLAPNGNGLARVPSGRTHRSPDSQQVDWVNFVNSTKGAESAEA